MFKTPFIMTAEHLRLSRLFKAIGKWEKKKRGLQKRPSEVRRDKSRQHGFVPTPIIERDNLHWCQGYWEEGEEEGGGGCTTRRRY